MKTNYDLKWNKKLSLFPLSDVHVGHQNFNQELFEFWIEIVRKNKGDKRIYLMGDLVDFPSTRVSAWDNNMSPNEAEEYIIQSLKQFKNDIIAVVPGNHEQRSEKIHNFNIAESIAHALEVPYSPADYFDQFTVNGQCLTVHFKHGTRFSRSGDLAMRGFKQDSSSLESDLFLMGHNHYLSFDSEFHRNQNKGYRRYYGFTGHFLNFTGSYAHVKGNRVLPAGFMKLNVDAKCNFDCKFFNVDKCLPEMEEI